MFSLHTYTIILITTQLVLQFGDDLEMTRPRLCSGFFLNTAQSPCICLIHTSLFPANCKRDFTAATRFGFTPHVQRTIQVVAP
jgi:hypothetical protein